MGTPMPLAEPLCSSATVSRVRPILELLSLRATEADAWSDPTCGKLAWGRALGLWHGSREVFAAAAISCRGHADTARMGARHPGKRVLRQPNSVAANRPAEGSRERFRDRLGPPEGTSLPPNQQRAGEA